MNYKKKIRKLIELRDDDLKTILEFKNKLEQKEKEYTDLEIKYNSLNNEIKYKKLLDLAKSNNGLYINSNAVLRIPENGKVIELVKNISSYGNVDSYYLDTPFLAENYKCDNVNKYVSGKLIRYVSMEEIYKMLKEFNPKQYALNGFIEYIQKF